MNASFRLLFGPGYTEKAYFLVQKVAKKHGLRPIFIYFTFNFNNMRAFQALLGLRPAFFYVFLCKSGYIFPFIVFVQVKFSASGLRK